MPDDFDHYYKWLAIPPAEQPPNHYRLLGLADFTDDPEVIANAADQRAAHLKKFHLGPRSASSQQLLNEVAHARVYLLNPDKKAAYDAELRGKSAQQTAANSSRIAPAPTDELKRSEKIQPATPAVAQAVIEKSPVTAQSLPDRKRRTAESDPLPGIAKIVGGGVAATAIGYLLLCWISPKSDFLGVIYGDQAKHVIATTETTSSQPPTAPSANEGSASAARAQMAESRPDSIQDALRAAESPSEPLTAEISNISAPPPVVEESEAETPMESAEDRLQHLTAERDTALANGNLESAPASPRLAQPKVAYLGRGEWRGDWQFHGDELVQGRAGKATLHFGDPSWTDYDVHVQLMSLGPPGARGGSLHFRVMSRISRYSLDIGSRGGTGIDLTMTTSGDWARVGTLLTVQHVHHRWYDLKVELRGSRIRCFVDGKQVFDCTDDSFPHGMIGLDTLNSQAKWKNLTVTAPDGTLLLEGFPDVSKL